MRSYIVCCIRHQTAVASSIWSLNSSNSECLIDSHISFITGKCLPIPLHPCVGQPKSTSNHSECCISAWSDIEHVAWMFNDHGRIHCRGWRERRGSEVGEEEKRNFKETNSSLWQTLCKVVFNKQVGQLHSAARAISFHHFLQGSRYCCSGILFPRTTGSLPPSYS